MEGAFAWLSQLIQWFGQFVPRWRIVRTTHGAVKFVRGSKAIPLGPGWHVYWPVTTDFADYPTARQANDLRPQSLVTSDGKTVLVGGLITYEIKDIKAILAETFDPEETVTDIALTAFHAVCSQKTWDELKTGVASGKLDREIRAEAKKALDSYGVNVLKTSLTDLAPCTVYKVVGNGNALAAPVIKPTDDTE